MTRTTMSTVDKALALLRHFSVQKPELGLSELAREAGYDKTTTLRCMTALERNGFVEQDATSRKYRLGLAPLNLAQTRERSFPVQSVFQRYLDELSANLGETAHATLIKGHDLLTIAVAEPERALRVYVDPHEILPFHATASGIAVAAYVDDETLAAMKAQSAFDSFTDATPGDATSFDEHVRACRKAGLGRASELYERDVVGTAAPVFGPSGAPVGAVAVAAVSLRMTDEFQCKIDAALREASRQITRELGGRMPNRVEPNEETVP